MMSQPDKKNTEKETVVEFLKQADSFPHNPETVTHVQTHISHVFIAPPYVYKIKKPVDFGFLDFSTLEKRKYFCEREVVLNRRLCSNIYLSVIPISKDDTGLFIGSETDKKTVEYAVKMKKLDDRYFLYSYIENDTLTQEHLDRVAQKLTEFYTQQDPREEVLKYGEIDRIRYNTDENFQQTEAFIGETIEKASFEAIQYFNDKYYQVHRQLFKRRVQEKRIVDGHGDLHLEHIHVSPDGICIYDCIEFNERFRYGDLAADLAFLAMDLDFSNRWKEERYFIKRMKEKLKDPDLPKIFNFYKCYRAYVKGKVKSLQSEGEEVLKKDRESARKKAINYFNLSLRYALLGSIPKVLVFMGRVATGKSTLADHLSKKLDIEYYSSDHIRKTMAGLPLEQRTPKSKRKELYSDEMSQKTYARLFEKAEKAIQEGESIILDATFSSRSGRQELIRKLDSISAEYLFIEAQASDETIRSRLKNREEKEGTASDARVEDFEKLNERYDKPEEVEDKNMLSIKTDISYSETVKSLYKKLADKNLRMSD